MKASIATTLSVAGVIAAGTAAFAVNTAVLDSGSKTAALAQPTTTVALVAPGATPTIAPAGDSGAVTQQELQTQPTTTVAPGSATATPTNLSDTTTTYKVGSSGSVVVDTSAGYIKVVSVVPAAGWFAEPAMVQVDGSVKIHFSNGTDRVEFVASLVGQQVKVAVTSDRIQQPTKPTMPPVVGGGDDDDDDGRGHHEDHEDHEDDEDD